MPLYMLGAGGGYAEDGHAVDCCAVDCCAVDCCAEVGGDTEADGLKQATNC